MTRNEVHVVPHRVGGFRWSVTKKGVPLASFYTKANAITFARMLARTNKAELFIHKGDGQIQSRDSYGHDPESRPG